jgi:hypothetical protein
VPGPGAVVQRAALPAHSGASSDLTDLVVCPPYPARTVPARRQPASSRRRMAGPLAAVLGKGALAGRRREPLRRNGYPTTDINAGDRVAERLGAIGSVSLGVPERRGFCCVNRGCNPSEREHREMRVRRHGGMLSASVGAPHLTMYTRYSGLASAVGPALVASGGTCSARGLRKSCARGDGCAIEGQPTACRPEAAVRARPPTRRASCLAISPPPPPPPNHAHPARRERIPSAPTSSRAADRR